MLKIWLNSKLQWNEHVKVMLSKMKIQINALICIIIFIWNVIFISACQIYNIIVRSVLAHETVIWHLTQSKKQKKFNAFNINEIFNAFLKIIKELFVEIITILIQTCWQLIYYFKHFHKIRTIILCKIKKNFYINSHFWKSIILLNIVEKIIKTIIVEQIWKMTEKHNMLFTY